MQEVAVVDDRMTDKCKEQIHATAISYAYVYGELTAIPELQEHVNQVKLCSLYNTDRLNFHEFWDRDKQFD